MKRLIATSAIVLALGGAAASAQDQTSPLYLQAGSVAGIPASELIGAPVHASESLSPESMESPSAQNVEWEKAGEIDDLLISQDGTVAAVLLDIGGVMGIGEKTVALDMADLSFTTRGAENDELFIAVSTSLTDLENAPDFSAEEAEADAAGLDGTAAPQPDMQSAANDMLPAVATPAATPVAATTPAPAPDPAAEEAAPADRAGTEPAVPSVLPETARSGAGDGMIEMPAEGLDTAALVGLEVYDPDAEQVGEIASVRTDETGGIRDAVIEVGGILGIGARPVTVDGDEIRVLRSAEDDEMRVEVSARAEELETRVETGG